MLRGRGRDCGELLDFAEVQRRLQLGTRVAIGLHEIPVANVIGSVSRVAEFDGCFRPRSIHLQQTLKEIRDAKPDAPDDPILVYQVDHAYFVVDGHKRMSMAIEDGRRFIDAEVEQYPSRYHVDSATTLDQIRVTGLERRFREMTGLAAAVPEARFPLADPHSYIDLAESVKAHAWDLSRDQGRLLRPEEAARHWYDYVYTPVLELARQSGVAGTLPSCREAELFLLLRSGSGLRDMAPGWQVPDWFVQQAPDRLRKAAPRRIRATVDRITGRARPGPSVLPPGDLTLDPETRAPIVHRPRRRDGDPT